MKRLSISSLVALLCACACLGIVAARAIAEDIYTNDFSKDLGKWKLAKAEGKVEAEGLKITKVEQFGGIGIEEKPAQDLSAAKALAFEVANGGDSELAVVIKIGSDKNKDSKDYKIPAGKTVTLRRDLADLSDVDLKKIDYVRLFVPKAGDVKLTIKKVTLVGGTAASKPASKPASEPAK
ncbi:MAG: hypothetical protein ACE15C_20325 [Phycisphaerae bacterium]